MTIIERDVPRDTICAAVRKARYPGHDPARWALPLITEADRRAGGVWSLVLLDTAEAGDLGLAAHAGEPCHGDTMMRLGEHHLNPGHSLAEAANWLKIRQKAYALANPSCWGRVVAARDGAWSPIVIAPFPVGDRIGPPRTPRVVIDGLHRALGWALRPSASPLQAYLAGPAKEGASSDPHRLDER